MSNLADGVQGESERFLREEAGATRCRVVNVLEFMKLVSENQADERVGLRSFKFKGADFTQTYLELNGEHIYTTIIGDYVK